MKIEITEYVQKVKVIDVELPYYYKYDLMSDYGDYVIYGKIESNMHTSIQVGEADSGEIKYEIGQEEHSSIKNSGLARYFDDKHRSYVLEYEEVKQRALAFLYEC